MVRIKIVLFFLLLILTSESNAQGNRFFIEFKDKQHNAHSISNPSTFLSAKAIARRAKYGIIIDSTDIPISQYYIDSVYKIGVSIHARSKWFNGVIIGTKDDSLYNQIKALGFVKSAKELDRIIPNKGFEKFNEAQQPINARSIANTDYGDSYNQQHQIGCDCLREQGFKGSGMTVAVLDAGFPNVDWIPALDSARNNGQILGGYDLVEMNDVIYDDHRHGTMVLSCMAGNIPGQLIGTATDASYILLHTEDNNQENIIEEYNWVAGAEYADSAGADVINSSLGYTQFDNDLLSHSYADMNGDVAPASVGADIAFDKGLLVVVSAGNSGADSWYYISSPADGDNVLAVGAVDSGGVVTDFSSRGPAVDGSIKPNVCAKGQNAVASDEWGNITQVNGTSFASPIMAGAAASLWSAFPNKSNLEIKAAIEESAHLFSNPDGDYGYGIPNLCVAKLLLTGQSKTALHSSEAILAPNPFTNEFSVIIYSADTQTAKINIYDIAGKNIYNKELYLTTNSYNMISPTKEIALSQGVYIVKVSTLNNIQDFKLIKQ